MSEANAEIIDLVAHIVSAYVSNNSVPAADLPALIATTHSAIAGLGNEPVSPASAEKQAPAVSIKKSITADFLICLEDGKKFKSLKRHVWTALRWQGFSWTAATLVGAAMCSTCCAAHKAAGHNAFREDGSRPIPRAWRRSGARGFSCPSVSTGWMR